MTKTFSWTVLLHFAVVTMIINVAYIQNVNAQTSCGNIIEVEDGVEFASPIDDCDLPFGPINTNESLEVSFDGVQIEDGGVYPLAGTTDLFEISGVAPFSSGTLYKHRDVDYVAVAYLGQTVTLTPGTYSLYLIEEELILTRTLSEKLFALIAPVAHAASGDYTRITFEITEPELEPEVDELILKYAPILYFHPSEDYFPMDVESFVEASALWSKNESTPDIQLKTAQELDVQEFESIIESGVATEDMYLAFSDPDESRSIDLQRARSTYAAMEQESPTVYYHKMTDKTNYGKKFTVLQYWYFYAMNNWNEKVGGNFTNNHEGDWESTFIFLNDATKEPEYVAYSSHLNDQYPLNHPFQYDSVRRKWDSDEIENAGDNVKNYVALGSHANYSDNGVGGIQKISFQKDDITSENGDILYAHSVYLTDIPAEGWAEYQGLWGTVTDKYGGSGPQGPAFINVTGQTRFKDPIAWAGLNNFFKKTINEVTDTIEDTKQGVKMVFNIALDIGTEITIELHNEIITFGNNVAELNPLPFFWDITSNLENDTFSTLLILQYSDEAVEAVGGDEEELVVVYYNPETNTHEPLDSEVDTVANTVSATTAHFSRYLLGFQEKPEIIEEPEVATSTRSKTKHNYGTRIKRPEAKVLGVSATADYEYLKLLRELTEKIAVYLEDREDINEYEKEILTKVLSDAHKLLQVI